MTAIVNVTANVSSRINRMRIVLIPGTMFVHIPFDTGSSPFNGAYGLFDWFRIFLRDSLFGFRLLRPSAISGVPPSFFCVLQSPSNGCSGPSKPRPFFQLIRSSPRQQQARICTGASISTAGSGSPAHPVPHGGHEP